MKHPIKSKEENPKGLHRHYQVRRADGRPVDPDAVFFVLRIDLGSDDLGHVHACRMAALTYVRHAPAHMTLPAAELKEYINVKTGKRVPLPEKIQRLEAVVSSLLHLDKPTWNGVHALKNDEAWKMLITQANEALYG